jgi:hypothetical protein
MLPATEQRTGTMMNDRVHVIWDNSNIFISGRAVGDKLEHRTNGFRINFENIIDLAVNDRQLEQVFCVGSIPPPTDAVWGHIEKKTGKKPELYERGAETGKEQAVDQALQVRMLRLGYDFVPPETLVLMRGDGRGFEEGVGFFADAVRMHKHGWKVEILAWKAHCKTTMRERAEQNATFIDLEEYYSSITWNDVRRSKPLDLSKRK